MDRAPIGPGGRASRISLLDLPEELQLRILRMLEDAYVESGQSSAEFLSLRTVCKKLQQGVDSGITNLSRGVARSFCRRAPLLEVKEHLQRQLARWGSLRRVELHVRGSNCAVTQLVPGLAQGCPGLTALRIVKAVLNSNGVRTCHGMSDLASLTALESLSLTGFSNLNGTLPFLPFLRTLEADFKVLTCSSPLPALEELVLGNQKDELPVAGYQFGELRAPHLHTSPRLRRISLDAIILERLQLPSSLQVLKLVDIVLSSPLDLGMELPKLAELVLVHHIRDLPLQGLSTLLARGSLHRLELYLPLMAAPLDDLPLQPRLTSLRLQYVQLQGPHWPEAVASPTALTDLGLVALREIHSLDVSHLQLQRLSLVALPELSSLEGLGLQTCLASLALASLPPLRQLPNLRNFRWLHSLELLELSLESWLPSSCSGLPRLKLLRVVEVRNWAPPATSAAASQQPPNDPEVAGPASALDFGTLPSLTELELGGLGLLVIDVSSLTLLKKLRIHNCQRLTQLTGLHSLPQLHTLVLQEGMTNLSSLRVASCPRLTTFSCDLEVLEHLTIEDLPSLAALASFPAGLSTLRVAACPKLERLPLTALGGAALVSWLSHKLRSLHSLELSGLPQLRLPILEVMEFTALRSLSVVNLPSLYELTLYNCRHLESVHISGCPLTGVRLENLPRLTAPGLLIDNLRLHAPDTSLPAASPAPPHPQSMPQLEAPPVHPSSIVESELPSVHPLESGAPPVHLPSLGSLSLEGLPGLLTLDQVTLHTDLTHLRLEKLRLACMPKGLGRLSALIFLSLKDVEVASWEPLPLDSFPTLRRLNISGGTNLVCWSPCATGGVDAPSVPQFWADAAAFSSIRELHLSELEVASLDVSQVACIEELAIEKCPSLTRLTSITGLPDLESLSLIGLPKLDELVILNCPKFKSLTCSSLSPRHLHLEDLPNLDMEDFECVGDFWLGFSGGRLPVNPLAALQSLKLRHLPTLCKLELGDLEALETVEVTGCSALLDVHLEKLASLTSLRLDEPERHSLGVDSSSSALPPNLSGCIQQLSITNMAKLESIRCPPTLRSLSVCSCWALTSLPFDALPHLKSLKLRDVRKEVYPSWFRQVQGLQLVQFDRSSGSGDD